MPFKKGQVTNPRGRPKGAKDKRTIAWEALSESLIGNQAEEFNNYNYGVDLLLISLEQLTYICRLWNTLSLSRVE